MARWPILFVTLFTTLLLSGTQAGHAGEPVVYKGPPDKLHIYMLLGQSNMSGRAKVEEEDKKIPDRLYLLDDQGRWVKASHPFVQYSNVPSGVDVNVTKQKGKVGLNLGLAFARKMFAGLPKDVSIGLIVNSKGGSSLAEWALQPKDRKFLDDFRKNPKTGLPAKPLLLRGLARTLQAQPSGIVQGVLWHQGENAGGADEKYLEHLRDGVILPIREELKSPQLPFVAGQLAQIYLTPEVKAKTKGEHEYKRFNDRIVKLPNLVPATGVARTNGMTTDLHFTSSETRTLGERYAVAMLRLQQAGTKDPKPQAHLKDIFARPNLVAWCIVPFDRKKRSPAERAKMVKKLGFSRVAYDWRDEHVASFEEEILQYKKHGIEYFAFWAAHDKAFELFAKYDLHPQIWQTAPSPAGKTTDERIAAAAKQLLPLVERTRKLKCQLGLYNHGGWGGEPDNLVAVCKFLREKHNANHVGIVYNLHHGHNHIVDFAKSLDAMKPYLLCLNLNGMTTDGDKKGKKILPLGAGEHDLALLKTIRESKYTGPIGIIGHTDDDVEQRLQDNLDGLDWLLPQLYGKTPGPGLQYRTFKGL